MKISHYKQGLGDLGIKMFDNLRVKHGLTEVRELLVLRIVAESWEDMVNTRKLLTDLEQNDPNSEQNDPKLNVKNKQAQVQLMGALKQLWWRMN